MPLARRTMTRKRRLDVLWASGGCCHICGEQIRAGLDAFEVEHVVALGIGGADDPKNWRAAHVACHATKTRTDRKVIAKAKRVKAKHEGTFRQPRKVIPGSKTDGLQRKMDGSVIERATGRVIRPPRDTATSSRR